MSNTKRAQSIVGTNNDGGRPENDFYPTPREGSVGLLQREVFTKDVWEPACGNGAMSKVLQEWGHRVYNTDIEPRMDGAGKIDFLKCQVLMAPCIVTNPPFILAQEFAQHALDLGAEKVALLCKLAFLETQERGDWLEKSPLRFVWVFKKRLSLYREGVKLKNGGMIAFAWFIWEPRWFSRTPQIGWI